ncbi:hypothetical protein BFW01_g1238 [Lasiodiplodia theobromae]|uniref:Uncharacterized protein n=1 Tax=Lasiodiplodia theobromae TaxID=45133 RepID=A0A8H7IS17_9PEZI|nr:hypothetical protein BFW01_g1238 [Lasiodiplodia theobromae]
MLSGLLLQIACAYSSAFLTTGLSITSPFSPPSASSVTSFTNPHSLASSAPTRLAVNAISIARCLPTVLANRGKLPSIATTPLSASGKLNTADLAATTRSRFATTSIPPPNARPFTAPTTGFFPWRRLSAAKPEGGNMVLYGDGKGCLAARAALRAFHSLRSAPAQKARPAPVTMAQRRVGSASYQVKSASSSWLPVLSMQLRVRGRLKVTRRMEGVGKDM